MKEEMKAAKQDKHRVSLPVGHLPTISPRFDAPEAKDEPMVKIKAQAQIMYQLKKLANGDFEYLSMKPGDEAEVPESVAKDLCKVMDGPYSFTGEIVTNKPSRHQMQRAILVS